MKECRVQERGGGWVGAGGIGSHANPKSKSNQGEELSGQRSKVCDAKLIFNLLLHQLM